MNFDKLKEELYIINDIILEGTPNDSVKRSEEAILQGLAFQNRPVEDINAKNFPKASEERIAFLKQEYPKFLSKYSSGTFNIDEPNNDFELDDYERAVLSDMIKNGQSVDEIRFEFQGLDKKRLNFLKSEFEKLKSTSSKEIGTASLSKKNDNEQENPLEQISNNLNLPKAIKFGNLPDTQKLGKSNKTALEMANLDFGKEALDAQGKQIKPILLPESKKEIIYWYFTKILNNPNLKEKTGKSLYNNEQLMKEGFSLFLNSIKDTGTYNNLEDGFFSNLVGLINKISPVFKDLVRKSRSKSQADKILSDALRLGINTGDFLFNGFRRTISNYGDGKVLNQNTWDFSSGARLEDLIIKNSLSARSLEDIEKIIASNAQDAGIDILSRDISIDGQETDANLPTSEKVGYKSQDEQTDINEIIKAISPIPKNIKEIYSKLDVKNDDEEMIKKLNAPLL